MHAALPRVCPVPNRCWPALSVRPTLPSGKQILWGFQQRLFGAGAIHQRRELISRLPGYARELPASFVVVIILIMRHEKVGEVARHAHLALARVGLGEIGGEIPVHVTDHIGIFRVRLLGFERAAAE